MRYDYDNDTVHINADDLAKYSHPKKSENISFGFKKISYDITSFGENEKYIETRAMLTDFRPSVIIESTADAVTSKDSVISVWTADYRKKLPTTFSSYYNAFLLAKAVINCYVYAIARGLSDVKAVILYRHKNDADCSAFERSFDVGTLRIMTEGIVSRAIPFLRAFAEREGICRSELRKLSFPYKSVRSGQERLMLGVMKTVRCGGMLVSSAPTGTGKTIATIYPSLKALGERFVDRIFYVTCKNITGKAAEDSIKLLSGSAPHIRSITIGSKESTCSGSYGKIGCFGCPKLNECVVDGAVVSYEKRRDTALEELLNEARIYDSFLVRKVAEKYNLCTYELSLDLSEYCDIIVCDANYVFDSRIRFNRYFKVERGEKYAFLIDEAHNLPDRIRSGYSASVSSDDFSELAELILTEQILDVDLSQVLAKCSEELNKIKESVMTDAVEKIIDGNTHIIGYKKMRECPEALTGAVKALVSVCIKKMRDNDGFFDIYKSASEKLSDFVRSSEFFSEGFIFVASVYDDRTECASVCLDPSGIIKQMCKSAYGTVLFSATLSPSEYFSDAFGYKGNIIDAESPFNPERLCVTVYDGISTRMNDRKSTVADVAEIIHTVISAKKGKYIVYFPSYQYMKTVARELLCAFPDIRAVMQKKGMTNNERKKFLEAFGGDKYDSLLGLCVLGGVFSEGVDLTGDSLIGVIVVGAGLAGLSTELNLIGEYYDEKYEKGYEYSYLYPAVNKIEQAAGRVIRTSEDRGCVILIDDRLASPEIIKTFPALWQPVKCTSDTESLAVILSRFWKKNS